MLEVHSEHSSPFSVQYTPGPLRQPPTSDLSRQPFVPHLMWGAPCLPSLHTAVQLPCPSQLLGHTPVPLNRLSDGRPSQPALWDACTLTGAQLAGSKGCFPPHWTQEAANVFGRVVAKSHPLCSYTLGHTAVTLPACVVQRHVHPAAACHASAPPHNPTGLAHIPSLPQTAKGGWPIEEGKPTR